MKKYRILFGRASLLALFTSIGLNGQQSTKIQITPELAKQAIEKHNLYRTQIFPVHRKEIEYHTKDTAYATKRDYKYALQMIEKYKDFDSPSSFQY